MTAATEQLTGLSVADLSSPITTFDQLGGGGTVLNKALAIPVHVGGAWNSVEYVLVPPVSDGVGSSVGVHVQATDEIYFVHRGRGVLTTNGEACAVGPGFLAVAPRGTRHSIRNESDREPLGFLVIELKVPEGAISCQPTAVPSLFDLLADGPEGHQQAISRNAPPRSRAARVDLGSRLSGPWGGLTLLEVPPGGHVGEYRDLEHDENIFVVSGAGSALVGGQRFTSEGRGLNLVVPRGLRRSICNDSVDSPLTILSVLVRSQGPRVPS